MSGEKVDIEKIIKKQEEETGGKLQPPTTEEAAKIRAKESEDFLNYGYPFEIGDKVYFIKELKIKDRLPLDKAYIKLIRKTVNIAKNINMQDVDAFVKTIEDDLKAINTDDIEFLIAGIKPWNPEIKPVDFNELTRTQVKSIAEKILEVNGMDNVLKKVGLPADARR